MGCGVFTPMPHARPYDALIAHLRERRKRAFAGDLVLLLLPPVREVCEVWGNVAHELDVQTVHAKPLKAVLNRAAHTVGRVIEDDVIRRIGQRISEMKTPAMAGGGFL